MKSLAALSKDSHIAQMPLSEIDLDRLRLQYHDLLSCYHGISVQVDAARFMSEKMNELFSFIKEHLSNILTHTQAFAVRPSDSRSCMLLLEYEIAQLLVNSNLVFDEFYVPRLHTVLKDFENQQLSYSGFRFEPILVVCQGCPRYLSAALNLPRLASISKFNLLTEKTSRIVSCINDAWRDRQIYASTYVDDLEYYFALRSELRGLSRSVSIPVKASQYKAAVCTKMRSILRGLDACSDSWMHESVNNLFM